MYVVTLNGSPRRSKGNTNLILEPFLHGLYDGGAKVDLVHLIDLNISPCKGQFECWFKTPGQCTLHDDMTMVIDKLRKSEIWVFSTGFYAGGPSGLLKNAMDRLLPLLEPYISIEEGYSRNKLRDGVVRGKLALVSSCAHWEMDGLKLLVAQMEYFCDQFGREFVGALLRPHATALPHMMWLGRETSQVVNSAQELGRQLAKEGKMEHRLLKAVSSELLKPTPYTRHINDITRKALTTASKGLREAVEDSLEINVVSSPFKFESSKDLDLNSRIINTINLMGGIGPLADDKYQQSIQELRGLSKRVVPAIVNEYKAQTQTSYLNRWSLVHMLGELGDPDALPALDEIINSPIPDERSKVIHEYSTRAEELMIRTTAVESIYSIAVKGDEEAQELLLKHAQHSEFSIRRAAIQSYIDIGGTNARKKLEEILSEKDRELLEIRRVDVRKVPQPRRFDITAHPKKKLQLPPREDEIPPNEKDQENDVPKSNNPRDDGQMQNGEKPCCS
jgi:multimeric flavodoxin WrbA